MFPCGSCSTSRCTRHIGFCTFSLDLHTLGTMCCSVTIRFLAEKPLPCHDLGRGKPGIISIAPFPYWVDCDWNVFSFVYPHSSAPLRTSLQLIKIITYCKSYTFTTAPATNYLPAYKSCMTQLTPKVTKQKCWQVNFDYDSVHVKCQDRVREFNTIAEMV